MVDPGVQTFLNGVLAVLVLYRTELSTTETFRTLAASCALVEGRMDLFVYDNSPEPLRNDAANDDARFRVIYHHDPANAGVSAAVNAGARLGRELGKEWLLLLDQDTCFPPESVTSYRAATLADGADMIVPQLVAGTRLLSPCGYRAGIGFHLPQVMAGEMALSGRSILNSGMLVRLSAFDACGGYDERVKVDFADFAFMNRFRRSRQKIIVLDLACKHGFSNLQRLDIETALRRFAGYCRDGRAAAVTPLLRCTHGFLVLRRCLVLTLRYASLSFLARLPAYFSPGERRLSP